MLDFYIVIVMWENGCESVLGKCGDILILFLLFLDVKIFIIFN